MSHDWDVAIRCVYDDPRFWEILLNESEAQAGPFDGACLICARALLEAAGEGELVRLASSHWPAEHYGADIGGIVYDFGGSYATPGQWLDHFQKEERVTRALVFARGFLQNPDGESAADDAAASAKIADLLRQHRHRENTWATPGMG